MQEQEAPQVEAAGKLDGSVLVLNRLWQAINVVSVRRAIKLLFTERVVAIGDDFASHDWRSWAAVADGDGARVIHGVSVRLPVPRVVQLLHFDRLPQPRIKFTRSNLYQRDRYRCQYCEREPSSRELTIDHVIPRSRGGRTTWGNVVASCVPCNVRKGDRTPAEAGMRLAREPRPPRWHPAGLLRITHRPLAQWRPFLPGIAPPE